MAQLADLDFNVQAEWIDEAGVTTPELRATWARYEIWLGGHCVTQVDDGGGSFRRSLFGSLYPLAEWIADNWWALTTEVRPSAVPISAWGWSNSRDQSWLWRHNVRAASDGMTWPDLTIVPEGSVTRCVWRGDLGSSNGRLSFAGDGHVLLATATVIAGLREFMRRVLTRLDEQGVRDTPLESAWRSVQAADAEEADFCRAAARLGLDPYSTSDGMAESLESLETTVPSEVLADFLDTVDPTAITDAVGWLTRADAAATRAAARTSKEIAAFQSAVSDVPHSSNGSPWRRGYAMARRIRELTEVASSEEFDCKPWVAKVSLSRDSFGLQGFGVRTNDARCAVAVPSAKPKVSDRFSQARVLGRALSSPDVGRFVLSRAHADDEKLAGAFAAELLAPAQGIKDYLGVLGSPDDAAVDAIANRYEVSSLVIRHQYENQILGRSAWYL